MTSSEDNTYADELAKSTGRKGDSKYTDSSPFVRVLRTEGCVRLLDAMLVNPKARHSVSDLKDKTGMARTTVLDNLGVLQEMGLVVHAGRISNADLYELNRSKEALKHLRNAQMALLTDQETREHAPDAEEYQNDEPPLGDSFGDPPEVSSDTVDQINVDI